MPYRPLQQFSFAPARRVVSLGQRCTHAYNIRRFYDTTVAFPFDWWFAPAWGVMGALKSRLDPDFIYDPALLEVTPDLQSVRHATLNIELAHEFPRVEMNPARPVTSFYRDHLAAPRARTAYLAKRLFALNEAGQRILFIRGEDQDERLLDVLDELFPVAEWTLAAVTGMPATDEDWRGSPALWDAKLAALGVTLDPNSKRGGAGLNPHGASCHTQFRPTAAPHSGPAVVDHQQRQLPPGLRALLGLASPGA